MLSCLPPDSDSESLPCGVAVRRMSDKDGSGAPRGAAQYHFDQVLTGKKSRKNAPGAPCWQKNTRACACSTAFIIISTLSIRFAACFLVMKLRLATLAVVCLVHGDSSSIPPVLGFVVRPTHQRRASSARPSSKVTNIIPEWCLRARSGSRRGSNIVSAGVQLLHSYKLAHTGGTELAEMIPLHSGS